MALLATPLSAFAEFQDVPTLWQAMRDNGTPRTFGGEAHGRMDKTYFSIWSSGGQEGNDVGTMKMRMRATFDMARDAMKLRAKFQLVLKSGVVYFKLDSIESSFDNQLGSLFGSLKQKRWIKVPLDEGEIAQWNDIMHSDNEYMASVNELLQMSHSRTAQGHAYTLTLTPEAKENFAGVLQALVSQAADELMPFTDSQMDQSVDMTIKVDTNAQDRILFTNFKMWMKNPMIEVNMKSTMQAQAGTVYVETPKDAVNVEEFTDILMRDLGSMSSDFNADSMDMEPFSDDTDTDMGDTGDYTDFNSIEDTWFSGSGNYSAECSDPNISAAKLMSMQRNGECPIERRTSSHYGR